MPLIDDDEFLKMCNELDRLKENEKDLKKGYIDLKLENIKIENIKKKRSLIILFLLITTLVLFAYLYSEKNEFRALEKQKYKLENLIKATKLEREKEKKGAMPLTIKKIVFAVQIGIFKGFVMANESSKIKGRIRTLPNDSDKYIAGEFYTYQKARLFRDEVRKMGIKDAFVIALHKGEKIPISTALKLLDD